MPRYRLPFFTKLVSTLSSDGIDCRVAIAREPLTQADRRDSADASWVIPSRGRTLSVGGQDFAWYRSGAARRGADAVITGLASTSIDTWSALLDGTLHKKPIGLWGHVLNYVKPYSHIDDALEQLQARSSDHVFAYTSRGTEKALSWGVPRSRITTTVNTIDMSAAIAARRQLTEEAIGRFRARYNLKPGRTAAYIGGLDYTKRLPYLAAALDHLWVHDKSFKLLLGGMGSERSVLARAIERRQVVDLGYADSELKALIGRTASTLLMPGRIGLVAVEALGLGLPIITTTWPFHGPEADYLVEGSSRFTCTGGPDEFAELAYSTTATASHVSQNFDYPLLDDMVDRFRDGVHQLLTR